MIVRRVAPIAFRIPISRVRSVTLTSMMFITPTPPTISATLESANSSINSPPVIWFQSRVSESVPNTAKLSAASFATFRRRRSNSVTSS